MVIHFKRTTGRPVVGGKTASTPRGGKPNDLHNVLLFQFTTLGQQEREESCEKFELLLKTVHQAMQQGSQPSAISLELGVVNGEVVQAIRTSDLNTTRMIKFRLRNDFQGVKLTNLPDSAFVPENATEFHFSNVVLENDLYAIKRWRELLTEADPVSGMFSALATNQHSRFFGHFKLTLVPIGEPHLKRHRRCFEKLQSQLLQRHEWLARVYEKGSRSSRLLRRLLSFPIGLAVQTIDRDDLNMSVASSRHHERESDVQIGSNKLNGSCFLARIQIGIYSHEQNPQLFDGLAQQIFAPLAQFNAPRLGQFRIAKSKRRKPRPFLLEASEVASIFHPPVQITERQAISKMLQLEPPIDLPLAKDHKDLFLLGKTCYHDQQHLFGLHDHDAQLHGFVVGSSGSGKTTLLKTAISSLANRGVGFTVVDFHGDLAREVKELIPKKYRNRLVDFDATVENPIAFNPLFCSAKDRWPVVADSVLSAMKNLFGDSWGPRLEQILLNALSACIAAQETTLMDVRRMLEQEPLRVKILSRVGDGLVREFWQVTFAGWSKSYRQEAIQSVINKLDALLIPKLRAMLCQTGPSFDFRAAFDNEKFIIVNLARGEVGQTAASTLGSLILSSIQNAALSRAIINEKTRVPHFVFLDEVQLYANPQALKSLLSEARKYRVAIWSATQSLASVDESVLPIIVSNAANLISFRISSNDSDELCNIFDGKSSRNDLIRQPRFHAYARLTVNGEVQKQFSLLTKVAKPHQR